MQNFASSFNPNIMVYNFLKSNMEEIYAKSDGLLLSKHLEHVGILAKKLSVLSNIKDINQKMYISGLLHDIGKSHPLFQKRLFEKSFDDNYKILRHEISSLAFISLINPDYINDVIEAIISHHKSYNQEKSGLSSLLEDFEGVDNLIKWHLSDEDTFNIWSKNAIEIINDIDQNIFKIKTLTYNEAYNNILYSIEYVSKIVKNKNFSILKGLLVSADHFASAKPKDNIINNYIVSPPPNLTFFNRVNDLYPLSLKQIDNKKRHTLCIAPTGAGKTDFLLRQTTKRVFYILPFTASIDAMYSRFKNSNLNTSLAKLHGKSRQIDQNNRLNDILIQRDPGVGVKILTPHQICEIVNGSNGYEAHLIDLMNCDIILDEIHTYGGTNQAMILGVCRVLNHIGCNLHIGTATMQSSLISKIIDELGGDEFVDVIRLTNEELNTYNRHIIYKIKDESAIFDVVDNYLGKNNKILIVVNTVAKSQEYYRLFKNRYKNTPILLLHSRFKRKDRVERENILINDFNNRNTDCIVISTQVVEVSIDINFDMMITECASIDSLIQRFGRINRKRVPQNERVYKDIYVLKTDNHMPYVKGVVDKTFEIINDGIFEEINTQKYIDEVYGNIDFLNWEANYIVDNKNRWRLGKLYNSVNKINELLEMESDCAILESDLKEYESDDMNYYSQQMLEIPIPIRFKNFNGKDLARSEFGNKPIIINTSILDYNEYGLLLDNQKNNFL